MFLLGQDEGERVVSSAERAERMRAKRDEVFDRVAFRLGIDVADLPRMDAQALADAVCECTGGRTAQQQPAGLLAAASDYARRKAAQQTAVTE